MINETSQWKRLEEHVLAVKQTHLRNLMQDTERCFALMAEHKGILLDYSRENVLPETMVNRYRIHSIQLNSIVTSFMFCVSGYAV